MSVIPVCMLVFFSLSFSWKKILDDKQIASFREELAVAERSYTFVSHQQEVGAGYFDDVTTVIQGGSSFVTALTRFTEKKSSFN